jgi:hypothetical protein
MARTNEHAMSDLSRGPYRDDPFAEPNHPDPTDLNDFYDGQIPVSAVLFLAGRRCVAARGRPDAWAAVAACRASHVP